MKKLFFLLVISFFVLTACTSPNEKTTTVSTTDTLKKVTDTTKIAVATSSDTLKINESEIIFTSPDDEQIKKLIATDSDDFYTAADDNAFYNSQLMQLADTLGIKQVSTTSAVLDFKTRDNRHFIIDLLKLKDVGFPNYLFNGTDTPQIVDIDVEKSFLKKYFKK